VAAIPLSVGGIYFAAQAALTTSTPLVAVASGSMMPTLEVGDLIIVQGVPPADVKIDDIIIFDAPQGSRTIHRVKEVRTLPNGTIQFKTKGDANPNADPYWIPEQNVQGRLLHRIPYLGWLTLEPAITVILIAIVIIVIVVWPETRRKRP
jgi:signal peptidase